MDDKLLEYSNEPARKLIEKLYLNSKTADVHFVFGKDTDRPERVPAHKSILSVLSPVFDTMFYGSLPEQGDIPIVDASAEVFKEFLQFFYMGNVRLTSKNIADVMNLCKKYEVDQGLKICEIILQKTLTNNDVCWGYAVATFLEQENLVSFCEKKIKENLTEVVKSDNFLECDHKTMTKILEFVSTKCSASEIVFGCMEWAKAKCEKNNLEMNSTNVRAQFGELFNKIPFCKLTLERFTQHTTTYQGFFTVTELEDNIKQIATNERIVSVPTDGENSEKGQLILDRRKGDVDVDDDDDRYVLIGGRSLCIFYCRSLKKNLLLTGFGITLKRTSQCTGKWIKYHCYCNSNSVKEELTIQTTNDEIHIALSRPLKITNECSIELEMECIGPGICHAYDIHDKTIYFKGFKIFFEKNRKYYNHTYDFISKLFFKISE